MTQVQKHKTPRWVKVVTFGFIGTVVFGVGTLFMLLLVGIVAEP